MTEHNITLAVGATKVLHTAGTYCDRDIVVTAEKGDGYDNGYNEGIEAGKKAEYDRFWDAYQNNGIPTSFPHAFYDRRWNDITFAPKYDLLMTNNSINAFSWTGITDTKRVIDISNTTLIGGFFAEARYLKTIRKLVVSETTPFVDNTFSQCVKLEDIAIEGTIGVSISFIDSPLLTMKSVQSIIDALKDLTGSTAQTLTFHADVGVKLTEEQKASITAKNWTLVY